VTTTERAAALTALNTDGLFEAAVALSVHIETIKQFIADGYPTDVWQPRLEASQRAHQYLTAARIAK
jgi:type VI protein secretion system component VasF